MITNDAINRPLAVGDLIWVKRGFYSKEGYHIICGIGQKSIKTVFLNLYTRETSVKHISYTPFVIKIDVAYLLANANDLTKELVALERAKVLNGYYDKIKESKPGRRRINRNGDVIGPQVRIATPPVVPQGLTTILTNNITVA